MQNPAIAEQTLVELPLWGETWGFGANGDFSLVLSDFSFVEAAQFVAVTERGGDLNTEIAAATFFSLRA